VEERHSREAIELIDVMRVVWWGKWIILGCLLAMIGLAAVYLAWQPMTYRAKAEFLLREYMTAALTEEPIVDSIAVTPLAIRMDSAIAATQATTPGIVASLKDNLITLSRRNADSSMDASMSLVQAESALRQQLAIAISEELEYLANVAWLQSNDLIAQLEIMNQRLVEEKERGNVAVIDALAMQIGELESRQAQVQVRLDTLATAEPGDLFVLTPLSESSITVVKSNVKITLLAAGILGLLIGILLAFFVQYLVQSLNRERRAV